MNVFDWKEVTLFFKIRHWLEWAWPQTGSQFGPYWLLHMGEMSLEVALPYLIKVSFLIDLEPDPQNVLSGLLSRVSIAE